MQRNILFNDVFSTFYLRLYGVEHVIKDHSDIDKATRFMGYSSRLAARDALYAISHKLHNG